MAATAGPATARPAPPDPLPPGGGAASTRHVEQRAHHPVACTKYRQAREKGILRLQQSDKVRLDRRTRLGRPGQRCADTAARHGALLDLLAAKAIRVQVRNVLRRGLQGSARHSCLKEQWRRWKAFGSERQEEGVASSVRSSTGPRLPRGPTSPADARKI